MKKISTAATPRMEKVAGLKLTIGLDLGDRSSWYCVLDEGGEMLLEERVSTTPKALQAVFGRMPRSRIALETGTHSPWVSRLLISLGHETIVAHARNVNIRVKDAPLTHASMAVLPNGSIPVNIRDERTGEQSNAFFKQGAFSRAKS